MIGYPKRCQYGECSAFAIACVHDKRGCRDVCAEHAKLLAESSCLFGHSEGCFAVGTPWTRLTEMRK